MQLPADWSLAVGGTSIAAPQMEHYIPTRGYAIAPRVKHDDVTNNVGGLKTTPKQNLPVKEVSDFPKHEREHVGRVWREVHMCVCTNVFGPQTQAPEKGI